MKRIAQLLVLSSLLVFTSCFEQGSKKISQGATSNVNPNELDARWNSLPSNGLDLKISQNFINEDFAPADDDGAGRNPIEQMFKEWNDSNNSLTFFKLPAQTVSNRTYSSLSQYNDSQMGIYKSYNWFSNVSSNALAVTQYYGVRRNIGQSNEYVELTHADIIFNYRDYNFSTDSSSSVAYDFHSVILHELGHFVGLGHTNSFDNSVMAPYLSRSAANRSTTSLDKSMLENLYGTSSSLTAGSQNIIVSAQSKSDGPKVLPPAARESNGVVHGVIELRADGECVHYENDRITHRH